jgi:hypothetical protein
MFTLIYSTFVISKLSHLSSMYFVHKQRSIIKSKLINYTFIEGMKE